MLESAGLQSEFLVFSPGLEILLGKQSLAELLFPGERFGSSFTVWKDIPTKLCTPDQAETLDRLIL